jgi:hypothetical protein
MEIIINIEMQATNVHVDKIIKSGSRYLIWPDFLPDHLSGSDPGKSLSSFEAEAEKGANQCIPLCRYRGLSDPLRVVPFHDGNSGSTVYDNSWMPMSYVQSAMASI